MVLRGFEERNGDGSSGDGWYGGTAGAAAGPVQKQALGEAMACGSGRWLISELWHSRHLQLISVPCGNVAGDSALLLLWKLLPVIRGY